MTWEAMDTYQQLVEMHPDLNDQRHSTAFAGFLDRMWTKPATYTEFAKAYMEFTTSDKLTFPKLRALAPMQNNSTQRKKTKRTRRRRSRRNRKPKNA